MISLFVMLIMVVYYKNYCNILPFIHCGVAAKLQHPEGKRYLHTFLHNVYMCGNNVIVG